MASAKRKQDEKNLKTLRELVSQQGNKECFDCQQRGPTYVNMTIGSFVCTTCSGMLRGLTPPHRVKSISMATFTQEEIDMLRERGNEYCRAIWLGLMTNNTPRNTKDEQKMKDFMSAKYEAQLYYLDPSLANLPASRPTPSQPPKVQSNQLNQSNKNSVIIRTPPNKSSTLKLTVPKTKEYVNSNNVDFVADFSKVPDPSPLTIMPQESFANFDNNPIFNNTNTSSTFSTGYQMAVPLLTNSNSKTNAPPSEDRYAALKDLDSMMKQASLKDEIVSSEITWNIRDANNAPNSGWQACDPSKLQIISNPFTGIDAWQPSFNVLNNNLMNNNNNMQHIDSGIKNSANPFRPTQIPSYNNDFHWFSKETQNEVPSSHLANNIWQPPVTGFKVNPFVMDTGRGDATINSNNPFL